jgi:ComF family protein
MFKQCWPPLAWNRISPVLTRAITGCTRAFEELVFPWTCLICGVQQHDAKGPLCTTCRERLLSTAIATAASSCPRCALPVGPHANLQGGCVNCRGHSLGFDNALAMGIYEGSIRDFCLNLKHERNAWLARWMSDLLVESRRDELTRLLPHDAWIVPVPLHWWRRMRRGYNQAEALAFHLSHHLDLRVCQPLRRVKATDRLAHQSALERRKAMRDIFQAHRFPGLRGKTILLVDDILTTGATTGAAARCLKQAGAKRVVVAVLARTV